MTSTKMATTKHLKTKLHSTLSVVQPKYSSYPLALKPPLLALVGRMFQYSGGMGGKEKEDRGGWGGVGEEEYQEGWCSS